MPKFRVLAGNHSEGYVDEVNRKDPLIFHQGEVVNSKSNLVAIHNKPGSIKFEKVPENTPAKYENDKPRSKSKEIVDNLEELTVRDLKEMASQEEIEIDNAMNKVEIINAIRNQRDLV